ncbi:MAG: hypothetical protein ACOX16_03920 [Candidatus Izemoplasmatales bacterium]|jgi:hypothetical protein
MKKLILAIVTVSGFLILAALGILGITYGWFVYSTTLPGGSVAVGDLRYGLDGAFVTESIIVPGQELIAEDIEIINASPVTSQLRLKITYTRVTIVNDIVTPEEDYVYKNDDDDHLVVNFTSTFTLGDGDVTPGENEDDYWYYEDYDHVIVAESGLIGIIDSIYFDGYKTSSDYQNESIEVKVTIEVKQADHVTWSELAAYDFETGDPLP